MLGLLLIAQGIAAAQGPVAIRSEAQARAMTPVALADALLAEGHPPVDAVEVGPPGLVPPPPPGSPPQFDVRLWTRPVIAAEPGFCERRRIAATVLNPGDGPSVEVGKTETLLRLGRPCVGGKATYGTYADAAAISVIRDLDRLRRARGAKARVTFVDRLPAGFPAPAIRSGGAALAALDLREIHWAGSAARAGSLTDAVRQELAALPSDTTAVAFYAGLWSGVVARENGRITRVWLDRAIPPPF